MSGCQWLILSHTSISGVYFVYLRPLSQFYRAPRGVISSSRQVNVSGKLVAFICIAVPESFRF